jgi:hypothetical protein
MRRLVLALGAVMAMSGAVVSGALAAPNPAGRGEPGTVAGTSCGTGTAVTPPPGLNNPNNGFMTVAVNVYANFNKPTSANAAGKAASEYDIACYQFTTNH